MLFGTGDSAIGNPTDHAARLFCRQPIGVDIGQRPYRRAFGIGEADSADDHQGSALPMIIKAPPSGLVGPGQPSFTARVGKYGETEQTATRIQQPNDGQDS